MVGHPAAATLKPRYAAAAQALSRAMAAVAFLAIPRPIIALFLDLDLPDNVPVVAMATRLLAGGRPFSGL